MMSTPSGHFEDFAPTPAEPLAGYSPVMVGEGRWFVMSNDEVMFGVVWTDDGGALGVLATDASDDAAVLAMNRLMDENQAAGVSTTDLFNELLTQYPTDVIGQGDLADLLAAF